MCFSINFTSLANVHYVVCYKDYEVLEDHEVCSERKHCSSLDLGSESCSLLFHVYSLGSWHLLCP